MWDITEPIIIVLVEENPKQPGSAAHKRFNLYRHGMTRREALEAGIWSDDLLWDRRRGFIRFVTPAACQAEEDPD